MNQHLISTAAAAREALGNVGELIGCANDGMPRFELFHAASSICSQKVRSVLAYHAIPYTSQSLSIFQGQTYLPDYVRLRMIGCEHYGGALVSRHTGSTSTASGGCDGAVVPTLIDWQSGEVIVDSHKICIYLDNQIPTRRQLRPDDLQPMIDDDLKIIDNLPNYQMLMGRTVSGTESTITRNGQGSVLSLKKVEWCDHYLNAYSADKILVAAYTAKRDKELSAANHLFDPQAMNLAFDRAESALRNLNGKLVGKSQWLYSDNATMADLFWLIVLLRMKNTGANRFWENGQLPNIESFCRSAEQLPAIRQAVIDWPDAMF